MTLNWWIISPLGALQLFIAVGGVIVENDAPVIIPCAIGQGNYPSWKGPPMVNDGSTLYNYEQSPMFNPYLSEDKLLRMTWADNKIDLSFSAAIRTDEGNYSCSAARQGTSTVELYVRVPPSPPHIYNTITGSQNELTVSGTEGAPLTLTCISAGGYPQQTVNWYRESVTSTPLRAGPPVVVSGDLYNVTRSYTFTPTSSDDGKTYICQSSYSGEPQLIRYTEVKLFLKLHPSTPTVTALGIPNESPSSVNIVRCTSSGFRPKTISLSWTLGRGMNEPVSNPIVEENMTTNTFSVSDTYSRSVGRADNGKLLTCSINHETLSSPKTASVTLIVQFSTLITTITGNPSIVANGVNSVTFTCTTGSSNPASSIT
ncbi:immunoglobulin kappa light chain-like isoform X1 [Mya arenaria]|uniref:immunoglobulin kappa light chain-like isoform X1 n=1 Tax=Mya arenaria TaxID=6604 RepID=UPI0022E484B8|nr:immunoglobulin kappa light chain-like isoform X1 [Mya arenaria]